TLTEESVPTEKRIRTSVGYCTGLTTQTECAQQLWSKMEWLSYTSGDVLGPDNIWVLYDGETSQCTGLARFLNAHYFMLGFAGELRWCMPKADGSFAAETSPLNESVRLISATAGHPSGTGHDVPNTPQEKLRCYDANNFANQF